MKRLRQNSRLITVLLKLPQSVSIYATIGALEYFRASHSKNFNLPTKISDPLFTQISVSFIKKRKKKFTHSLTHSLTLSLSLSLSLSHQSTYLYRRRRLQPPCHRSLACLPPSSTLHAIALPLLPFPLVSSHTFTFSPKIGPICPFSPLYRPHYLPRQPPRLSWVSSLLSTTLHTCLWYFSAPLFFKQNDAI